MRPRTILIAMCLLIATTPAFAASPRDHDDCNADDADRNIAGCTRVFEDRKESKKVRAIALVGRGLAWKSKGDRDKAIADFTAAIRLEPNDALPYNNRANIWRELGEIDRAIADLTEAIRIDPHPRSALPGPGYVNVYANRGLAFHAKGDHERALADYDQALQLHPNDSDALYHRSLILCMNGNYERAIADLDKLIRVDPDNADAYHLRGIAHYEQYMGASAWIRKADLDRAIADFSELIRLQPTYGNGYYLRGRSHNINGDRERAIADMIEGSRVDPLHLGIRAALKELKPDYQPPATPLLKLLEVNPPKH